MDWLLHSEPTVVLDSVKTAIFLVLLFVIRILVLRVVSRIPDLSPEARHRWVITTRNILFSIFILGVFFIWAHELSTLAVSLMAIALAIVLATKELILCFSGAVIRMGTNAYLPGDRIEIGSVRGKVLDQSFMATRVLEIGHGPMGNQYTGRTVVFPNSLLLTHPLINETNMMKYVMHVILIPLSSEDDWATAERLLLDAAHSECSSFISDARQQMKKKEGKDWLDVPSVEPRVTMQIPEAGQINLLLRVALPTQSTLRIEQAILRRFLSAFPLSAPRGNN